MGIIESLKGRSYAGAYNEVEGTCSYESMVYSYITLERTLKHFNKNQAIKDIFENHADGNGRIFVKADDPIFGKIVPSPTVIKEHIIDSLSKIYADTCYPVDSFYREIRDIVHALDGIDHNGKIVAKEKDNPFGNMKIGKFLGKFGLYSVNTRLREEFLQKEENLKYFKNVFIGNIADNYSSNIKKDEVIVISINPEDVIFIGDGDGYNSCTSIKGGDYGETPLGYLTSPDTVVAYKVKQKDIDEANENGSVLSMKKTWRNIFLIGESGYDVAVGRNYGFSNGVESTVVLSTLFSLLEDFEGQFEVGVTHEEIRKYDIPSKIESGVEGYIDLELDEGRCQYFKSITNPNSELLVATGGMCCDTCGDYTTRVERESVECYDCY